MSPAFTRFINFVTNLRRRVVTTPAMGFELGLLVQAEGDWKALYGKDRWIRERCKTQEQKDIFNLPIRAVIRIHHEYDSHLLYTREELAEVERTDERRVNAFLAHSRGVPAYCSLCEMGCVELPSGEEFHLSEEGEHGGVAGPMLQCRRLPGHFQGACSNCIYIGKEALCCCRDRSASAPGEGEHPAR